MMRPTIAVSTMARTSASSSSSVSIATTRHTQRQVRRWLFASLSHDDDDNNNNNNNLRGIIVSSGIPAKKNVVADIRPVPPSSSSSSIHPYYHCCFNFNRTRVCALSTTVTGITTTTTTTSITSSKRLLSSLVDDEPDSAAEESPLSSSMEEEEASSSSSEATSSLAPESASVSLWVKRVYFLYPEVEEIVNIPIGSFNDETWSNAKQVLSDLLAVGDNNNGDDDEKDDDDDDDQKNQKRKMPSTISALVELIRRMTKEPNVASHITDKEHIYPIMQQWKEIKCNGSRRRKNSLILPSALWGRLKDLMTIGGIQLSTETFHCLFDGALSHFGSKMGDGYSLRALIDATRWGKNKRGEFRRVLEDDIVQTMIDNDDVQVTRYAVEAAITSWKWEARRFSPRNHSKSNYDAVANRSLELLQTLREVYLSARNTRIDSDNGGNDSNTADLEDNIMPDRNTYMMVMEFFAQKGDGDKVEELFNELYSMYVDHHQYLQEQASRPTFTYTVEPDDDDEEEGDDNIVTINTNYNHRHDYEDDDMDKMANGNHHDGVSSLLLPDTTLFTLILYAYSQTEEPTMAHAERANDILDRMLELEVTQELPGIHVTTGCFDLVLRCWSRCVSITQEEQETAKDYFDHDKNGNDNDNENDELSSSSSPRAKRQALFDRMVELSKTDSTKIPAFSTFEIMTQNQESIAEAAAAAADHYGGRNKDDGDDRTRTRRERVRAKPEKERRSTGRTSSSSSSSGSLARPEQRLEEYRHQNRATMDITLVNTGLGTNFASWRAELTYKSSSSTGDKKNGQELFAEVTRSGKKEAKEAAVLAMLKLLGQEEEDE